jgi:predicted nucleic acid-binding protein
VNDLEVMKKAAFIYIQAKKKGKPTKQQDIDFIIAAWSLYVDSIVVTLNTKDFDTIDGLQITNWGVK